VEKDMDESTSLYPANIDALAALDDDALVDGHGIVVDWRACEDEVVADFGRHLASGDSLTARLAGSELYAAYNGAEHHIPLTHSPADRYVAICSMISILGARYELRRLKSSVEGDTHVFLLLLREDWRRIDDRHRAWADSLFEAVPLGKDGFGRGETVPYVQLENLQPQHRPWWRLW
jgi:hypothetical protein